jgi:transcriptional regulator with XRE-family HTH domain
MTQIEINVNSPLSAEMHNLFHKNIVFLRKKRKLTQEKLALELNITRSRLSSWEENRASPQLMTLVKVSQYFDVSMLDLVTKDLEGMSSFTLSK